MGGKTEKKKEENKIIETLKRKRKKKNKERSRHLETLGSFSEAQRW